MVESSRQDENMFGLGFVAFHNFCNQSFLNVCKIIQLSAYVDCTLGYSIVFMQFSREISV